MDTELKTPPKSGVVYGGCFCCDMEIIGIPRDRDMFEMLHHNGRGDYYYLCGGCRGLLDFVKMRTDSPVNYFALRRANQDFFKDWLFCFEYQDEEDDKIIELYMKWKDDIQRTRNTGAIRSKPRLRLVPRTNDLSEQIEF
jgi:hypothetical protein